MIAALPSRGMWSERSTLTSIPALNDLLQLALAAFQRFAARPGAWQIANLAVIGGCLVVNQLVAGKSKRFVNVLCQHGVLVFRQG